jgi:RNA polymerase sigma-70 factor (ECF subfamily)
MAKVLPFRAPRASTPDPTLGDEALVVRAREGAQWARAALFQRHAPALLGFLTRLLASTADAEDAAQDTFIEALRDLHKLRVPADFPRWLTRIGVHQAHRRFRRRRLLTALGFDGTPLDATLDLLADEQVSPEARADLSLVQKVLARLSAAERTAWVLRYVEGLELTEVAQALGVSLATAKRKLATAMEAVQASTHFEHGGEP